MKYLILFVIKLYWMLIPASRRNNCLFSQSCSKYVYPQTKENGFIAGIRAFKIRYKQCRPGYSFDFNEDSKIVMRLADGSFLTENQMSDFIVKSNEYVHFKTSHNLVR